MAGVTILFLFVTIKLEKKVSKTAGKESENESDEKPKTEEKEKGTKDKEKSDQKKECVCKAHITDYSLQGNVYIDKDVRPGDPKLGVTIHELIHLRHHRTAWEEHKKELETLLDKKEYVCKDDCKSQIIQDVFAWFKANFYSDQKTEEEDTQILEKKLEKGIAAGTPAAKALKDIFGKDELDKNAKEAKPDKDLPLAGRFTSSVIPTWEGSCAD